MAHAPIGSSAVQPGFLDNYANLFMKQTKKGWFQECLGCEAQTEFKIATMEDRNTNIFYALEDTTCLNRFCLNGCRPFVMNVHKDNKDGEKLAYYERPMKCLLGNFKCCCHQEITAFDGNGRKTGMVKEKMWYCVPGFALYSAEDQHLYDISMPTCFGGLCVDVCAEGLCNCRIPFYYFPPNGSSSKENKLGDANLTKIWTNVGRELFTDATTFEHVFPADANGDAKITMVGAAFLINQLFFEGGNEAA